MRSKFALAMCLAALGGCTERASMNVMQAHGDLRVDKTPTVAYDYTVTIRNIAHPGFVAERREDREGLALSAMKAQCPGAKIVGEDFIKIGEQPKSERMGEFKIKVFCPPA